MAYATLSCLRLDTFKRYSHQNARFCSLHRLVRGPSPTRVSFCRPSRHYASGIGGPLPGQPEPQGEDAEEQMQTEPKFTRSSWSPTLFKMLESAATTFASILVLGLAGYGYHRVRGFFEQDVPVPDYFSTCELWSSSKRAMMPIPVGALFSSISWRWDAYSETALVL